MDSDDDGIGDGDGDGDDGIGDGDVDVGSGGAVQTSYIRNTSLIWSRLIRSLSGSPLSCVMLISVTIVKGILKMYSHHKYLREFLIPCCFPFLPDHSKSHFANFLSIFLV